MITATPIRHAMAPMGSASAVVLDQAEPEIEEAGDAGVDDSVADVVAVAAGGEDPLVDETLQLVGDRLDAHAHGIGELAHRKFPGAFEGMQETQPVLVGEHLEQRFKLACGGLVDKGTLSEAAEALRLGG